MIFSNQFNPQQMLNNRRRINKRRQNTLGKLASGRRINSSADDVAGSSISQRMRAQIRGAKQAQYNVQDANSLVQVADGAMQEISTKLQRIRELTVQGANDTLSYSDRITIQNEIDELQEGITDIVINTEFNTKQLLLNEDNPEYVYKDRAASNTSPIFTKNKAQSVNQEVNLQGSSTLNNDPVIDETVTRTLSIHNDPYIPTSSIGTTVMNNQPRFSEDGSHVVFTSARDGKTYEVANGGEQLPNELDTQQALAQKTESATGEFRLEIPWNSDNLRLQQYNESFNYWQSIEEFEDFNYTQDGDKGFSFSPIVGDDGETSFTYSDIYGNIKQVKINADAETEDPIQLVSSEDTLNLPPGSNTLELNESPSLYRMNTAEASLRISKVNYGDNPQELKYWDGEGSEPEGGYYTIEGSTVEFFADAIIGKEDKDSSLDYYQIDYVSDGYQDEKFRREIPSNAEIYNMDGGDGPRSLDIQVDGESIDREYLLSEAPENEEVDGVFLNEVKGYVEFYGRFRPAFNQSVNVKYKHDADERNEIHAVDVSKLINTYNLTDEDLSSNRALRVFVGNEEITYKNQEGNGYTYDQGTGKIYIHGDKRPDIPEGENIRVEYIEDQTTTTGNEVHGISLGSIYPEYYNPGGEPEPSSITVQRVSNGFIEEISYDENNGFQYDRDNNKILLYGDSRPDAGDLEYRVEFIMATGEVEFSDDGVVRVDLSGKEENYGIEDSAIPDTFHVTSGSETISYDQDKKNGFFYNEETNQIEIYGDARPHVGESVEVTYVKEFREEYTGNNSYDFHYLPLNTAYYGLGDDEGPTSIAVYDEYNNSVPYDSENGFSYDTETGQISLHGEYRPSSEDKDGTYTVRFFDESILSSSIPEDHVVAEVSMNGETVKETDSMDGDGFYRDGRNITLLGDARPDISHWRSQMQLEVKHSPVVDVTLDDSVPASFAEGYCDHVNQPSMPVDIDPDSLTVLLNGENLTSDQYYLEGSKVILQEELVELVGGDTLEVDYKVRGIVSSGGNQYTMQIGSNNKENMDIEISSFSNVLRLTNQVCIRSAEHANMAFEVIDHAIQFTSREQGEMGAVFNRLEHVAMNLDVREENTSSAMSRIEDADMAQEMVSLVKSQIIGQAQLAVQTQAINSAERALVLLE
ncbi:flagellin [Natronospora cellulosivora (SeqCode)]